MPSTICKCVSRWGMLDELGGGARARGVQEEVLFNRRSEKIAVNGFSRRDDAYVWSETALNVLDNSIKCPIICIFDVIRLV